MFLVQIISIISLAAWATCTIAGLSYMDPLNTKSPEEDPCNPLFWYPKNIPEYCYSKNSKTQQSPIPFPLPLPFPMAPLPLPYPMGPMYPAPPYPMAPSIPIPIPPMPLPPMPFYQQPLPLPFGIPLIPTNPMLPVAGVPALPYPSIFPQYRPQYQAGMVPGLPGIVTSDGGINILPFSDVYADILEKHKQKLIRKKIHKVLNDYDDYPEGKGESRRRNRH